MKKVYLLSFALCAFAFTGIAQVEQTDDIEAYDLGDISPQSFQWRTWSGDENTPEEGQVTTDQANSGSQSMVIGPGNAGPQDQLFLTAFQPSSGIYTVAWEMYVPSGHEGFFNVQGEITTPQEGSFLLTDHYFNPNNQTPGQGQDPDANFTWTFPHDTWFNVTIYFDLDAKTYELIVDGDVAIPAGTPFNDLTAPYLGGVDFFAPSEFSYYFIDDVVAGVGQLSTDEFSEAVFSVYPNPVKNVLNIESAAAVSSVTIYDVLGKAVLSAQPDAISPKIDMSGLSSGAYLVQVTIDGTSKTVKVIK
ncbi:T9SS type A sorting domain-containing protein [Marixanthomonas spongiae]|uniref:T9SS C-terminal target domain-containing protein n=1 Tax=Marixanthomonas spongiae TaxID=2174845 RepID=A0A2U0I093_9FLAO|nr:T9SS type A sorting domain-containing protein [Marixanthomonas spongiae]PVW14524.1 T9SS C-terminal target domain-containing protein [Marixanthomonas spongiae]